jgi:hypothetical protein
VRSDIEERVQTIHLSLDQLECLRLMLRCYFVHCLELAVQQCRDHSKLVKKIVLITDEYRALDGLLEIESVRSQARRDGVWLKLGPQAFRFLRRVVSVHYHVADLDATARILVHRPAIVRALDGAVEFEEAHTFVSVHAMSGMVN